jgi:transcriptional regulator with XRE-family HTH domain
MRGKRKGRLENRPYAFRVMPGRTPTKEAPPFGRRLAALRTKQGLTQAELAKLLGTSVKMVDYYERRARNPAVSVVEKCAAAFGVPLAELTSDDGGEESRKPRPGPRPQWEERMDRIRALPRAKREFILKALDALLRDVG